MAFHYPARTWAILLGMIATGAARSIAVKLAYQAGFEAPLAITLLYLLGQALSLLVYGVQLCLERRRGAGRAAEGGKDDSTAAASDGSNDADVDNSGCVALDVYFAAVDDGGDDIRKKSPRRGDSSLVDDYRGRGGGDEKNCRNDTSLVDSVAELFRPYGCHAAGSVHGLTSESGRRTEWVHHIPYLAKPAIPSVFNLLNSAMRWGALVYIDASVAEMMISGLELTLSVVAARIFRHRLVSWSRWAGVVIVTIGVLIVEQVDMEEAERSGAQDTTIGVVLILLQSILSVMQDTAEEIFMQADDFPATLMLGLEGLYGFAIGLIVYFTVADGFGIEDIASTRLALGESPRLRRWLVGLPFLFLVTGIFNIKATEVTSAMTRNVWKNFRTILVWAIGLGIYYVGDGSYGEAWHVPESFCILLGFVVMFLGVFVYYFYKERERPCAC